jgi:hypothetical protein
MKTRPAVAIPLVLGLTIPGLAVAHHSTEALFDRSRTVEFVGILNKVDIINPHSWFRFDEYRDGSYVREWSVEGGAPSQIRRAIIEEFGSLEFEVGKKYTVTVLPGRADEADGYLKKLVFPDGSVFTCC